MSPAHWDRLPPKAKIAKESKPRKPKDPPYRWQCRVEGCGEFIDGGLTALDRHMDAHGGGRAECIGRPA